MSESSKMLSGYRLTTAEITYHMPDYHDLLQVFIWQTLDLPPDFPRVQAFLDFWERELDGPLFSVRLMYNGIIKPVEWIFPAGEYKIH